MGSPYRASEYKSPVCSAARGHETCLALFSSFGTTIQLVFQTLVSHTRFPKVVRTSYPASMNFSPACPLHVSLSMNRAGSWLLSISLVGLVLWSFLCWMIHQGCAWQRSRPGLGQPCWDNGPQEKAWLGSQPACLREIPLSQLYHSTYNKLFRSW